MRHGYFKVPRLNLALLGRLEQLAHSWDDMSLLLTIEVRRVLAQRTEVNICLLFHVLKVVRQRALLNAQRRERSLRTLGTSVVSELRVASLLIVERCPPLSLDTCNLGSAVSSFSSHLSLLESRFKSCDSERGAKCRISRSAHALGNAEQVKRVLSPRRLLQSMHLRTAYN